MSISYVIMVGEKKFYMFWKLDMMSSNEKKNHQNPSTNKIIPIPSPLFPPGKLLNLKDVGILYFTG